MDAVLNKDLLIPYLITLKLKETVEAGIPKQSAEEQQQQHYQKQSSELALKDDGGGESEQLEPSWVISIRDNLEVARRDEKLRPWDKLSIYRVPKYLREGGNRPFVPQIVSIGPYYREKGHLRGMEYHKWRSLQQILSRTGHDIRLYLDSVGELEKRARSCYEGSISLSSEQFVQCMVVDGCFILEIFRCAIDGFHNLGYSRKDPVFAMRGLIVSIISDIIMLENQIPIFVLDRLLALQLGLPANHTGHVSYVLSRIFDYLNPTKKPLRASYDNRLKSTFDPLANQGGIHCLDALRRRILFTRGRPTPPIGRDATRVVSGKRVQQLIHSVTELRESGIELRRRKTDRFWDIKFHLDGVLEIPRLRIHSGTKSLFLNLIAFEQCHLECSNHVTTYVIFMDNLINEAKDVRYLRYRGILKHSLGSDEEVADLFNQLSRGVVFDIESSYLSKLPEDLIRYYSTWWRHRWNAWKASLNNMYFQNPWTIISLLAAIILLALTFISTLYVVYTFYQSSITFTTGLFLSFSGSRGAKNFLGEVAGG